MLRYKTCILNCRMFSFYFYYRPASARFGSLYVVCFVVGSPCCQKLVADKIIRMVYTGGDLSGVVKGRGYCSGGKKMWRKLSGWLKWLEGTCPGRKIVWIRLIECLIYHDPKGCNGKLTLRKPFMWYCLLYSLEGIWSGKDV